MLSKEVLVTLVLFLCILALSYQRFIKLSRLLVLMLLGAALALPLVFNFSLQILISVSALFIFLIIEFLWPREKVEWPNSEYIIHTAYALLRRLMRPIVYIGLNFLLIRLFDWPVDTVFQSNTELQKQLMLLPLALLLIDFKTYWLHRSQHKFNFWWSFHKAHHSSTKLNVLAADRDNLVEVFVTEEFTSLLIGYLIGLDPVVMFYGVWLPQQLIGAFFAHSNIALNNDKLYWWQYIIASPSVHALHHTKGYENNNFGTIFIFWDLLFGTFHDPKGIKFDFGLAEDDVISSKGLIGQQLSPIYFILESIKKARIRR